jgi:probable metal-binding protein
MGNVRHIHEVLDMIYSTDKKFSTEEFPQFIEETFGDNILFTSCSDNIFPVNEVLEFLVSRNKIRIEDGMVIALTPACNH